MKKYKVLIIDDSSIVRQTLSEVISSDPQLEVMATASDPFIAAKKISQEIPDVITLDVEMPKMDGLTFLKKIMTQKPIPVVMCSSLTIKGSNTALKALEIGAIDIIQKPKLGTKKFLDESRVLICDTIKAAATARLKKYNEIKVEPKLTADAVISKVKSNAMIETTEKIIAVGASTGGTDAIRVFLESMPLDSPGIVIVQHMPENFTKSFAERLNTLCRVSVKEAEDGDTIVPGSVLIAPGNKHMLIKRSGARYFVEVKDGPLVSRHRPSVDVLFRSAARYAGANAVGVIMTGMGDDGAKGMKEMRDSGAHTIAQNEESCVVFGMPKEAIALDAAVKITSLRNIAYEVVNFCR